MLTHINPTQWQLTTGQPSEMDPNPQAQDIDIPNDYWEDIDILRM